MRIYTVHESPFWALAEEAVPGADVVLIAEGFCWPAALFTVLWAAWHRLWLVALAILGAGAALDAASALVPIGDAARTVLGLAVLLFIGFEANDWRRWTLERRGWRTVGIVAGHSRSEAEHRFFTLPGRATMLAPTPKPA